MIGFNIQVLIGSILTKDVPINVNFSDAEYVNAKADVEKFLSIFKNRGDVRYFVEYWYRADVISENKILRSWYLDHLP